MGRTAATMIDFDRDTPPRGIRWLAVLLLLATLALIWVGAGVTTRNYGMAVFDWPTSLGHYNPPGWWQNVAIRFEHGHRLLGQWVGLLTAALFTWAWFRHRGTLTEYLLILAVIALMIYFAAMGGRPEETSKMRWWTPLILLDLGFLLWWFGGWLWRRWHPLRVLTSLAAWAVVTQAIMGGVRVTKISDAWAIFHGCFAQGFFCLIVLIVMATRVGWAQSRDLIERRRLRCYFRWTSVFLLAVVIQLVLGASMRHLHRVGLPATDFPTMNGQWIPAFDNADIVLHFCHRVWAFVVLAIGLAYVWRGHGCLADNPRLRRLTYLIPCLLAAQITLGIFVVISVKVVSDNLILKPFWITNLHVLTGLGILVTSFILLVRGCRALPTTGLLAEDNLEVMRRSDGFQS